MYPGVHGPPPPSYSTTSTHPNIVNNVNSVTNLEGNNSVGMASMHAPKVRSYSSGIWGHPPGKQLKFHAKNGAFYAFWELYLNKFTVPHFVIFRNYKNNYTKKGYLSQNPWDIEYYLWAVSLWAMSNKIPESHGNSVRVGIIVPLRWMSEPLLDQTS